MPDHKVLLTVLAGFFLTGNSCRAQDVLGTGFGVPNSSPAMQWPKGEGIEALTPANLYPNGPQFGLSNTSGGFGTSGTGPMSGVGLAERTVSPLVREEMERPFANIRRLTSVLSGEEARSNVEVGRVLSDRFRGEMRQVSITGSRPGATEFLTTPYSGASVDAILKDKPDSIDSILNRGL